MGGRISRRQGHQKPLGPPGRQNRGPPKQGPPKPGTPRALAHLVRLQGHLGHHRVPCVNLIVLIFGIFGDQCLQFIASDKLVFICIGAIEERAQFFGPLLSSLG